MRAIPNSVCLAWGSKLTSTSTSLSGRKSSRKTHPKSASSVISQRRQKAATFSLGRSIRAFTLSPPELSGSRCATVADHSGGDGLGLPGRGGSILNHGLLGTSSLRFCPPTTRDPTPFILSWPMSRSQAFCWRSTDLGNSFGLNRPQTKGRRHFADHPVTRFRRLRNGSMHRSLPPWSGIRFEHRHHTYSRSLHLVENLRNKGPWWPAG